MQQQMEAGQMNQEDSPYLVPAEKLGGSVGAFYICTKTDTANYQLISNQPVYVDTKKQLISGSFSNAGIQEGLIEASPQVHQHFANGQQILLDHSYSQRENNIISASDLLNSGSNSGNIEKGTFDGSYNCTICKHISATDYDILYHIIHNHASKPIAYRFKSMVRLLNEITSIFVFFAQLFVSFLSFK